MNGWIEQWYPNSPVESNVLSNVLLGDIGPESNNPSSEVTVCSIESSFVQKTVLPSDRLIWGGTNDLPLFGSAALGTITTESSWEKIFCIVVIGINRNPIMSITLVIMLKLKAKIFIVYDGLM